MNYHQTFTYTIDIHLFFVTVNKIEEHLYNIIPQQSRPSSFQGDTVWHTQQRIGLYPPLKHSMQPFDEILWQLVYLWFWSNLTQGRTAAAHERFNRIRQVSPICTPSSTPQSASAPYQLCSLLSRFEYINRWICPGMSPFCPQNCSFTCGICI